ncbi:hypothetical protein DYB26_010614 [Aphanomyces astaci]|uniref:Myb/SANT-like domain-containing protein n=2 Tax=Aphanomyces astaci TaxID=112090 RepID=A0A397FKB1_APHAT|nr:hypothetical protein DYB26_010614 [Aphanomyces astaci]RHZ33865.1 hypothetical protein DYB31_012513 [Aphanomyces astaci]
MRTQPTMPPTNQGAMDKAKRGVTTRAERLAMLEFLRVPEHFALMTGQATRGKVMKGGQRLTKAHGHSLMAQYVNKIVGDGSRAWSAQDAKLRYSITCKKSLPLKVNLDSICPYYNDMNALFGERQNFRPSYTLETNNHVDGSQTLDNSFVADDSDDNDAKDGEQPGNDPDSDEYWAQNDVEDPGRTDADAAVGGKANKRPDVPRVFPTPEKRLTPRKDFSSIYMDAQIQVNALEREKFEYQKECDRVIHAAAASQQLQCAKASMIEKLVGSGIVDVENIRELVAIAFPAE